MVADYRINPKKTENLVTIEKTDKYLEHEIETKLERFLEGTRFCLEGNVLLDLVEKKQPWHDFFTGHKVIASVYILTNRISVKCESCHLRMIKKLFEDFSEEYQIKVEIKIDIGDC
jgi:hypothetical protein